MPEEKKTFDEFVGSVTRVAPIPCIIPQCTKPQRSRGLCNACARRAYHSVEKGTATWADLEELGFALPPKDPTKQTHEEVKAKQREGYYRRASLAKGRPLKKSSLPTKPIDPLASKTINQSLKINSREGFALAYLDAWAKLYSPGAPIEEKRLWPPDQPIYVPAQFRKEEETK